MSSDPLRGIHHARPDRPGPRWADEPANIVARPPVQERPDTWLINGFPARVYRWSAREWAALSERPADARRQSDGTWLALRMD